MKTKTNTTATATATATATTVKLRYTSKEFSTEVHANIAQDVSCDERLIKLQTTIPEGLDGETIKIVDSQIQALVFKEGKVKDQIIANLAHYREAGLTKRDAAARLKEMGDYFTSKGITGYSTASLCRLLQDAGYEVDAGKAASRAARTAKAKAKAKTEAKPLAEALKEYALNAAKTKSKARAALEAALELLK